MNRSLILFLVSIVIYLKRDKKFRPTFFWPEKRYYPTSFRWTGLHDQSNETWDMYRR